jgi:hypothetical protein
MVVSTSKSGVDQVYRFLKEANQTVLISFAKKPELHQAGCYRQE